MRKEKQRKDEQTNERLAQRLRGLSTSATDAPAPPQKNPEKKSATRPQRTSARTPAYKIGLLAINQKENVKCVVSDRAETGARVALEGAIMLPPVVTLKIVTMGFTRKCEVAWQDGNQAGLKFID